MTYEFIGVWDEIEADFEDRPIVRLTRCKDCKHYDGFDCDRYADETYGISHSTQEYGYCWLAERKDNGKVSND